MVTSREAKPSELTVLFHEDRLIGFRYHPHHRRSSTVIHCPHTARRILQNPYYSGVGTAAIGTEPARE